MGITIHYSGRAKNYKNLTELMNTAQLFGAQRGWQFAMYDDPLGELEDRDPDDPGFVEPTGPCRGIVLRPHPKCEPLRLQFDHRHELEPASTKTQFAPFGIHKQIIELLRLIEPFMETFEVVDEAELWETGDEAAAKARFKFLGDQINKLGDSLNAGNN